jgi:hypothetical protein
VAPPMYLSQLYYLTMLQVGDKWPPAEVVLM